MSLYDGKIENEEKILLLLLKDLFIEYNANNISKEIGITPMGSLKILKKLEKQGLLIGKKMGKSVFYKINLTKEYNKTLMGLLLQKEAESGISRVKRWINELNILDDSAEAGILFGSVLDKEDYKDVDLMLILNKSQNKSIDKKIERIHDISTKKIHLIRQTENDLLSNLDKRDKVIIELIKKGVILFGYHKIIDLLENVTRKKQA
jgi:DNA-binding Lrp family transcriptional regulator